MNERSEQYRGFTISYRLTGFGSVEAVVTNGRGGLILTASGMNTEIARRVAHNRIDYHLSDSGK
jgi:hypothetical protein